MPHRSISRYFLPCMASLLDAASAVDRSPLDSTEMLIFAPRIVSSTYTRIARFLGLLGAQGLDGHLNVI